MQHPNHHFSKCGSYLALLLLCLLSFQSLAQEKARIVFRDAEDNLRYRADTENNYIADFSHAGYHNGEKPLPTVPTVMSISPVAGDNTAHIQAAIDQVSAMPLSADGFRGALLLEAGAYPVSGSLRVNASGVVIRGVGQGEDPAENTVIRGVGNREDMRELIVFGAPGRPDWSGEVPGTRTRVLNEFVPAGSRTLWVTAAELYSVGDNVIVYHPSTREWLASINNGDTAEDAPWQAGEIDIYYNRYVTDVNIPEQKITLDAPIFDRFERALAQAEVYVLDEPNQLREVGIENLRIFIETQGELTETHARTCIVFDGVEDAWIRDVMALHFIYALVDMRATTRVTVTGCSALEPHSLIMGARRYNFNVSRQTNNVLFTNCMASDGRHSFVSNGTSSASGIVWHNCVSSGDYNGSEGHRRWSQGLLFDNIDFISPRTRMLLGLYNRGDFGTGHGWSTTNGVAWNVRMPITNITLVQKPPGRQNYAIGGRGFHSADGRFDHPRGYSELMNQQPEISSLYEAQLAQRKARGVAPDAPARLSASAEGANVVLTWDDIASRETGYAVVVSGPEDTSFTLVATLPENTTEFTHENPSSGSGNLIYRVYATGQNGPSPFSNPVAVDVMSGVRQATAADLRIIPNPVVNRIQIETQLRVAEVIVYDLNGRAVERISGQDQIDGSSWPAGTYFLRITDAQGSVYSRKVIKR